MFCFAVVCDKCGYENPDDTPACEHCGAVFKESKIKEAETEQVSVSNAEIKKLVAREVEIAGDYFQKGEHDMAALFYRNAIALDLLSGGTNPVPALWRERMLSATRIAPAKIKIKCRMCGGSGRRTVEVTGLDSKKTSVSSGLSCLACGGTGVETVEEPLRERKERLVEVERQYTAFQRARKYVKTGGAWIPFLLEARMSARQTALVRRFCASPCNECSGFGRVECGKCKGTGMVKCPNRECKNGQVFKEKKGELSSGTIRSSEKCPVCHGKGMVACEECRGRGGLSCEECGGSGERPVCDKCEGAGLVKCSRCGGSGIKDGKTCLNCNGEKVILCPSCGGDGHDK